MGSTPTALGESLLVWVLPACRAVLSSPRTLRLWLPSTPHLCERSKEHARGLKGACQGLPWGACAAGSGHVLGLGRFCSTSACPEPRRVAEGSHHLRPAPSRRVTVPRGESLAGRAAAAGALAPRCTAVLTATAAATALLDQRAAFSTLNSAHTLIKSTKGLPCRPVLGHFHQVFEALW